MAAADAPAAARLPQTIALANLYAGHAIACSLCKPSMSSIYALGLLARGSVLRKVDRYIMGTERIMGYRKDLGQKRLMQYADAGQRGCTL